MCFLIHLVRRAHQLEVGDNKIKTNEGKFRSTLIFKEKMKNSTKKLIGFKYDIVINEVT